MNMVDPRETIAHSPMSRFQITAIFLCVCLNALDGFDVLSISFAAPGIAHDWNITRAGLGIVLSIELIGMSFGSLFLGQIADRIGRRPTIIFCLVFMALGMFFAATATSIAILCVYRFLTGIGIGGVLASINAMAAEYSNKKRRPMVVATIATGYSFGAIIGGAIVSILMSYFTWRSVFVFGGVATVALIPLILLYLPESIEYLIRKRPANALIRINTTLKRMGHEAITALPELSEDPQAGGIRQLFSASLIRLTILLTVAYFAHIMTFYFILKWLPKIVFDMGFSHSLAGTVLVWANVGGAVGSIVLSLLTQKFATRGLVVGAMLIAAVMVIIFGAGWTTLIQLAVVSALAGFFTNSAIVGTYALMAHSFPVEVRAGGTGFVIGVGRAGSALGPVIAGFLFSAGVSLQVVAIVMAMGSLVAALALLALPAARIDTRAEYKGV